MEVMKKKLLFCSLLILILISGCSQQEMDTQEINQEPNTVIIKDFAYMPQELNIDAGTIVTWKHDDKVVHDVVATNPPGSFANENMQRGDKFTFTFSEPGEYEYYCSIHPSMRGKIIVK